MLLPARREGFLLVRRQQALDFLVRLLVNLLNLLAFLSYLSKGSISKVGSIGGGKGCALFFCGNVMAEGALLPLCSLLQKFSTHPCDSLLYPL